MQTTKTRPLNQQDLTNEVHGLLTSADNPTTKDTAARIVKAVFRQIEDGLREHGEVKLVGFGRFFVRTRPARKNFNLQKRELEDLPAKQVVAFAPGWRLKQAARVADTKPLRGHS